MKGIDLSSFFNILKDVGFVVRQKIEGLITTPHAHNLTDFTQVRQV